MTRSAASQQVVWRVPDLHFANKSRAGRLPDSWKSILRALANALAADDASLLLGDDHGESACRFTLPTNAAEAFAVTPAGPREPGGTSADGPRVWLRERKQIPPEHGRLGARLSAAGEPLVQIELSRSGASAPFGPEDLQRLNELVPGVALSFRASLHCAASDLATRTFQRLPHAVALVTPTRQLLSHNQSMQAVLDDNDGLRAEHGVIRPALPDDHEILVRALRLVSASGRSDPQLFALHRPSGRPPYFAVVDQLNPELPSVLRGQPMLRLSVVDLEHSDDVPVAHLARYFRLTPTETDVVQCIMRGMDVAACARELGQALSTVRWHQKGIFAKTGTAGRAALILLFVRATSLIRES